MSGRNTPNYNSRYSTTQADLSNLNTRLRSGSRSPARRASQSPVSGRGRHDSIGRHGSAIGGRGHGGGESYADHPNLVRGNLTNQEHQMNSEIDQMQHMVNDRRGNKRLDVQPFGMSYDHMKTRLGGQASYGEQYGDHGQVVYLRRARAKEVEGGILHEFEGKFLNKFFQRYRVPTEESIECPEPPRPEPFPRMLCLIILLFWIFFLIWTIILLCEISDLDTKFRDQYDMKVIKDMSGELDKLELRIKSRQKSLTSEIQILQQKFKDHTPILVDLHAKYIDLAKRIKKLRVEVSTTEKDLTKLKKFQIVARTFLSRFIHFIKKDGSHANANLKKHLVKHKSKTSVTIKSSG